MRHHLLLPALALALIPAFGPRPAVSTGRTVTVKMVDVSATAFKFDPATITVSPGDTIHFVQTTKTPHNVDFKSTPEGANLGSARMGPFLVTEGATYDLALDARFPAGTYQFACTPHEMLGMKGSITVQPR